MRVTVTVVRVAITGMRVTVTVVRVAVTEVTVIRVRVTVTDVRETHLSKHRRWGMQSLAVDVLRKARDRVIKLIFVFQN